MFRTQQLALLTFAAALWLLAGTNAGADVILTDNFNTVADPGGLNDDLSARQGGSWAPTTWDAVSNGATANTNGGQLTISGTGTSWNDAFLHNSGTDLVGGQYVVATQMDFTAGYPGRAAAITVKNSQGGDVAAGTGTLFLDMGPANGGADLYWELRYNSGSGLVGNEDTIAGAGKNVYSVELRIDETETTKTASLVVDNSTIYTLDWNPGTNVNRYIGLGYNTTFGGAMKFDSFSVATVPEPATGLLMLVSLFGLLAYAWKRR